MKKITRILAISGVILLVGIYAAALVFALMDSPSANAWFQASLFCTFAVPFTLYAFLLAGKMLRGKGEKKEAAEHEED